MGIAVRPATAADEPFLWQMLYEAAHADEEGMAGPDDLRAVPELALYLEGWGRPGDRGVVAIDHAGDRRGAAWLRLLTRAGGDTGYGWVDDDTPELAIATVADARGDGVGTALITRLLADAQDDGVKAVSLSVREDNPARRLYERLGFRVVDGGEAPNRTGDTSLTMVAEL